MSFETEKTTERKLLSKPDTVPQIYRHFNTLMEYKNSCVKHNNRDTVFDVVMTFKSRRLQNNVRLRVRGALELNTTYLRRVSMLAQRAL